MRLRNPKWAAPHWLRWDSDVSFSITTTMAGRIFSSPMATSKTRSSVYRSVLATPNLRIFSAISAAASFRKSQRRWGKPLPRPERGGAYGDIGNDGNLDVLVTTNSGPAYLFHNEGGSNHSLRLKLVGTKPNRDGIGAVVHVTSDNNKDKQWKMLRSGSSYLSQSELVLTFGLGAQTKADSIEIEWPSGQVDKLSNVNAGQTATVQEGKGIVGARAYGPPPKSSR